MTSLTSIILKARDLAVIGLTSIVIGACGVGDTYKQVTEETSSSYLDETVEARLTEIAQAQPQEPDAGESTEIPPTPRELTTEGHVGAYHDAFDRQFPNITIPIWTLIEGAPGDWWEPKSEFETQAQYNNRMQEAEQGFLQASNEFFTEAEDLVYLIYVSGQGNWVSGTHTYYDGMVLHSYDPERNMYKIDIDGDVFIVNAPITLNWDVASLPNGVEFIDDISYIGILLNAEENYVKTWCYPDVIRLRAQVPVDVAQQIRELDVDDSVTVRFFVKFDFPDNLRSYAWAPKEHLNLIQGRPVEPEPGAIVATMLRAELFDINQVYFVWE